MATHVTTTSPSSVLLNHQHQRVLTFNVLQFIIYRHSVPCVHAFSVIMIADQNLKMNFAITQGFMQVHTGSCYFCDYDFRFNQNLKMNFAITQGCILITVYGSGSCRFTQGHVYCMQGSSSRIMDALWPKDSQGREGIFKHTSTLHVVY